MDKYTNLAGMKFGRLTVIGQNGTNKHSQRIWKCLCECGKTTDVITQSLANGNTKSCGCLQKEAAVRVGRRNRKHNTYEDHGDYVVGKDSAGNQFVVDKATLPLLKDAYWFKGNKYFQSVINGKRYMLHRFITNEPEGLVVDHINHDTADNRMSNLRICTRVENQWNHRIYSTNTSGVTGVTKQKNTGRWEAELHCHNRRFRKVFDTKEEAIKQRRIWETLCHGEFAPAMEDN